MKKYFTVRRLENRLSVCWYLGVSVALMGARVFGQSGCAPAPSGLVAWWAGEGNALDSARANHGTALPGTTYGAGQVGNAFVFDGSSAAVIIPPSADLAVQSFTFEAWIFPTDVSGPRPIVEYANASGYCSINFWYGTSSGGTPVPGGLYGFVRNGNDYATTVDLSAGPGWVPANQWSHVAFTFDPFAGTMNLVVNGTNASSKTFSGIAPDTSVAVNLGYRPSGSAELLAGRRHLGKLDEVSIYNRALSLDELQTIYQAGSTGKCALPIPPYVLTSPTNQTVVEGDNTAFSVLAGGALPLDYQWTFYGTNLPGATNSVLILKSVRMAQAGNYAVTVSNSFGTAPSSDAWLTVEPRPPCSSVSVGMISWWSGDDGGEDIVGTNPGNLSNGVAIVPGLVRQAMAFNGSNQYFEATNSPTLNPPTGITVEAWVRPTNYNGNVLTIVSKDDEYANRQYLLNIVPSGANPVFRAHVGAQSGFAVLTGTNVMQLNAWSHVAMTYDGLALKLYVNGVVDSTLAASGSIRPTTLPLRIGRAGGSSYFVGLIDEVSLYGRALSAVEIQGIYAAGIGGKCLVPVPPFVMIQPTNQTVILGANPTFTVVAAGSAPLCYQWSLNGTSIQGATNSSLIITNAQFQQGGIYAVAVTNAAGSVSSSNALLTLTYPPAIVRVGGATAAAGGTVTVPVSLVANGNENALGFSLGYDASKLSFVGASLGSGAGGAVLMLNTSLTNSGKVGLALAMPPAAAFAPGTQQLAQVRFVAAILTNSGSSSLTFGDQPTARQLLDGQFNFLSAWYSNSTVSITAADFEGDLFPRPGGDKTISLADWLLLGRYVARLDYPTNGAEFQRADCAPRATGGDGTIRVTDWVQCGRYAFGLDPWALASGPTNEVATGDGPPSATRILTLGSATLAPGQPCGVGVTLAAQGNENALGFSVTFDPAQVRFTGASLGADGAGATLYVNSTQAGFGRVGLALALGTGTTFAAGNRDLARLNFTASASGTGSFSPGFGSLPVPREVSDAGASALPVSYSSGSGSPGTLPALRITRLNQEVAIAWPLWASNYTLQQAAGVSGLGLQWTNTPASVMVSGNENVVNAPIDNGPNFFRLVLTQ